MKLRKIMGAVLAALLLVASMPVLEPPALAAYNMPYYIEVDVVNQIVTIYSTSTDVIVRQMICSTGKENSTPHGTYYLPRKKEESEREPWYYFRMFSCYAQYATRIFKGVMFHSIPCSGMSQSTISKKNLSELGTPASHGCVRLRWQDAEFIAKCCMEGTRVKISGHAKPNEDLRQLLFAGSYTNEKGQSYEAFLGVTKDETAMGQNSKGSQVRDLQTRLRDLGIFSDEISGRYGGSTVNAVRQAQRLMGDEESGVATSEFREAIYADDAPTAQDVTVQEGMSGPVVRNIQQALADLRLYDGAIDGVFDVDVLEAAKKFQGAYGYKQDGVLTPEIQKALHYETGMVKALFGENGYDMQPEMTRMYMGQVASRVAIRLRQKATAGSSALGRLTNGDRVVGLDRSQEWSKVQRGKDVGYVKNDYLDYYDQENYVLTYTDARTGDTYVIGCTPKQYYEGAQIHAEAFEVYLASGGSLDDFANLRTLARVNTEPGVSLNLREAADTGSAVLAELASGTEAEVLERGEAWSHVEIDGAQGYLMNDYLVFRTALAEEKAEEPSAEDAGVKADESLLPADVRGRGSDQAPVFDVDSDDADVLGHLKNGTRVDVVETVDGWSLILYKGHKGYMKDEDLQFMLAEEIVA